MVSAVFDLRIPEESEASFGEYVQEAISAMRGGRLTEQEKFDLCEELLHSQSPMTMPFLFEALDDESLSANPRLAGKARRKLFKWMILHRDTKEMIDHWVRSGAVSDGLYLEGAGIESIPLSKENWHRLAGESRNPWVRYHAILRGTHSDGEKRAQIAVLEKEAEYLLHRIGELRKFLDHLAAGGDPE